MNTFQSRVAGIPCRIRVTEFERSEDETGAGYDIEFEILDMRGKPARWLEAKMDLAENRRIMQEIVDGAGSRWDWPAISRRATP